MGQYSLAEAKPVASIPGAGAYSLKDAQPYFEPEKPSLVSDTLKYSPVGMIKGLADTIRTAASDVIDGKNPLSRLTGAAQENAKMLDRAKTQIQWAEDDFKKGNYTQALNNGAAAALHFVNYLAPGGSAMEDIATDFQNGDHARGLLKTAGLASTVLAQQKAPAVRDTLTDPELPGNIAAGAKGAVRGAIDAGTADAHFRGISVPGGNVMAGAVGGGAAARALGLPTEAGAIVGGAAPIVRGAVTGAKSALATRAAEQAAALSRSAEAAPAPGAPRALLTGTVVTPPPPDASFVRSVPLAEANPQMAAQVGAPPPAPVPTYEGVPVPALNEMAVKSGFKEFAEVPKDYQPILANLTRVELEKQAAPTPTTQPAPVVSRPAPTSEITPRPVISRPAPGAPMSKADLAKRALADEMVKNGTATPEMLKAPADLPDPEAVADMMRDLPAGAPKAIAKANYAGNQEPRQAGIVYDAAGRAAKSQNLATMLYDEGAKSKDIANWDLKKLNAEAKMRGMDKAFSMKSFGEIVQQLRKMESAK